MIKTTLLVFSMLFSAQSFADITSCTVFISTDTSPVSISKRRVIKLTKQIFAQKGYEIISDRSIENQYTLGLWATNSGGIFSNKHTVELSFLDRTDDERYRNNSITKNLTSIKRRKIVTAIVGFVKELPQCKP